MNRINKYQESILDFLKKRSFINDMSKTTKTIIHELIDNHTDHFSAILCLTILKCQCYKNSIRTHGYYIASGIDILMIIAKICSCRGYYDKQYGALAVDNLIMESTMLFYKCITQNIETLRLSKSEPVNPKLAQLCIEYAAKMLPEITFKQAYDSDEKMKKTDLFCFDINSDLYSMYKTKNKLDRHVILKDTIRRYGSVCKLALCIGWTFGQNDNDLSKLKSLEEDTMVRHMESLSEHIGIFLKIYDDFTHYERDIAVGTNSLNYILNYGIKEAYTEMMEAKTNFIAGSMTLGIDTKTSKEIIDFIVKKISIIVKDVSVDMETSYDDVSTI